MMIVSKSPGHTDDDSLSKSSGHTDDDSLLVTRRY